MASPKIVQFQPAPPSHRVAVYAGDDGAVVCRPVDFFVLTTQGVIRPYSIEDNFLDEDDNYVCTAADDGAARAAIEKAQK